MKKVKISRACETKTGIYKERRYVVGQEKIFEEIITEDCLNLKKDINL